MQVDRAQSETKTALLAIPEGAAGVRATLKIMRGIIRDAKTDYKIRALALELVQGLNQKDFAGEVKALHAFVQNKIRYVKDIHGIETLQTPVKTLEIGQGDCDDKAILLSTLLEVLGHPARLVAVGFAPGRYSHVYPETKVGRYWVPLETTEPWPAGKGPTGVKARMLLNV